MYLKFPPRVAESQAAGPEPQSWAGKLISSSFTDTSAWGKGWGTFLDNSCVCGRGRGWGLLLNMAEFSYNSLGVGARIKAILAGYL